MRPGLSKRFGVLFLLLLIAIGGWWLIDKRPTANPNQVENLSSEGESGGLPPPVASSSNTPADVAVDSAIAQPNAQTLDRPELLKQMIDDKNVSVRLFGKVVDQDERPLSGVNIRLTVRQWHLTSSLSAAADFIEHKIVTKADGRFDVDGEIGDSVSIKAIEKEGYELSRKARLGFGYNGPEFFQGDSSNPVVYRMWKKIGAEPLVTGKKFFGVVPDGRDYSINLLAKSKTETLISDGDLRVRIIRPVGVSRNERYDWSFVIEAPSGGIVQSVGEFMFRAPESGYVEVVNFELKASDPEWSRRIKKSFFTRTRGQLFGRINIEVFAFYDGEAAVEIEFAVNPSGSKNLEYDPAAQPKPAVYE